MTNIDRAEAILTARYQTDQMDGDGAANCFDAAAAAQALADAGLLAPEPRIIRTRDELAALDPETVLFDVDDPWYEVRMSASEWMEDYAIDAEAIFPLAVIATGEQVRAARQAMEATE